MEATFWVRRAPAAKPTAREMYIILKKKKEKERGEEKGSITLAALYYNPVKRSLKVAFFSLSENQGSIQVSLTGAMPTVATRWKNKKSEEVGEGVCFKHNDCKNRGYPFLLS